MTYKDNVLKMQASIDIGHIAEEQWLEVMGIEVPTQKYTDWLSSWLIGEGWVKL